jgi:hypothetical protein
LTLRKRLEMRDERIRRDAHEPRGKPALRHEGLRGAFGQSAHPARYLDVLGQVEVVSTRDARSFRHADVAVEGQAGDDGVDAVTREMRRERGLFAGIDAESLHVRQAVRRDDGAGDFLAHVRDLDRVVAGFGH